MKNSGFVYLVKAGDFLKIGISNEVSVRVEKFKTACPLDLILLAVIEGGREVEKDLHKRFKHLKTHGEWFKYSEDIVKSFNTDDYVVSEESGAVEFGDLVLVTKGYYRGTIGEYDDDQEFGDNGTAVLIPLNRDDLDLSIVVKNKHLKKIKYSTDFFGYNNHPWKEDLNK